MHEDQLSNAIKQAAETFEPPWLDVRTVVERGRRRWWLTRPAIAITSLALVATGIVAASAIDLSNPAPTRVAARALTEWDPMAEAPIAQRAYAASAWTGTELVVWGGHGVGDVVLDDGAAYDASTGTWRAIPRPPARTVAEGATSVWTGTEMILWGGDRSGHRRREPDGAAFDPATNEWRRLPRAPYWSLGSHTAVWTGSEMLVWGGAPDGGRAAGAAYDPETDEWRRFPVGPLGGRDGHEAVWTGTEMIVWGGASEDGLPAQGPDAAAYDPASNEWRELPAAPIEAVDAGLSVWTGEEMIVTGGYGADSPSRAGAAYDPDANEWRTIADVPLAEARDGAPIPLTQLHTNPVWTGEHAAFVTADGVLAYAPEDDGWSRFPAPDDAERRGAISVWTGDALVAWGGGVYDAKEWDTGGWIARY